MSHRALRILFAAAVAVAPAIASPRAAAAPQAPATASMDDRVRDQVMLKLAGDPDVKGGGLEVDVKEGTVTLKGKVDTDKAKSKAARLARRVRGVKNVDNQLTVGP